MIGDDKSGGTDSTNKLRKKNSDKDVSDAKNSASKDDMPIEEEEAPDNSNDRPDQPLLGEEGDEGCS